jgi:alkylation response protein AidB-like acyl-CoA dehydrogenase
MSLRYAKERIAFGRPIGMFQAMKHKLADLLLEVEFARAAVDAAACAAAQDTDEVPLLAGLAAAHCSQTYALVATENIHVHGGIGFTWEHDAQLYFKRAKSSQLLFGDADFHRERIAARLLDDLAPC